MKFFFDYFTLKEYCLSSYIVHSLTTDSECGNVILFASIFDKDGKILEFDSLALRKKCSDNPGLSLKVVTGNPNVINSIEPGMKNPFQAIGISSISVTNSGNSCPGDSSSPAYTCYQTGYQVLLYLKKLLE